MLIYLLLYKKSKYGTKFSDFESIEIGMNTGEKVSFVLYGGSSYSWQKVFYLTYSG